MPPHFWDSPTTRCKKGCLSMCAGCCWEQAHHSEKLGSCMGFLPWLRELPLKFRSLKSNKSQAVVRWTHDLLGKKWSKFFTHSRCKQQEVIFSFYASFFQQSSHNRTSFINIELADQTLASTRSFKKHQQPGMGSGSFSCNFYCLVLDWIYLACQNMKLQI